MPRFGARLPGSNPNGGGVYLKVVELLFILQLVLINQTYIQGLLRISARIIISLRDYRMRYMRIVLVEQRWTGCTNK